MQCIPSLFVAHSITGFINSTTYLYFQILALHCIQANCLLFTSVYTISFSEISLGFLDKNTQPFLLDLWKFWQSILRFLWKLLPLLTFCSLAFLYHLKFLHKILIPTHTQYSNSLIYITIIFSTLNIHFYIYIYLLLEYKTSENRTVTKF